MKYLVISRIGSESLHLNWLATSSLRKFDIVLSAYDANVAKIEGDGIVFEYRPGRKVEGYSSFFTEQSALWQKYDYVCMIDEDIRTDYQTLNELFSICAANELKISQPALTHDSYFTYAATLRQPMWKLRYVNFIEMMCPIFRRDVLKLICPLYNFGYESGIDLIWCNIVSENPYDFAIIDCAPVRHTEPVGNNKAANGFLEGRIYEDDIYDILQLFKLPWLSCTPYCAISQSGKEIRFRALLFLATIAIIPAVFQKGEFVRRLRSVSTHMRHVITRRPLNIKRSI